MKITTLPCGPIATNTYIVHNQQKALLIDPADFNTIWNRLNEEKLEVEAILLTHGHFDHISGLPELCVHLPEVPVYIHSSDKMLLFDSSANGSESFFRPITLKNETRIIHYENTLSVFQGIVSIFYSPGHTPGSVVLQMEQDLFTGDFLFKESIGRTDFARSSPRDMQTSLKNFVYRFKNQPHNLNLYPGHGEATTLEHELQFNPFLDKMTKHMGQ